MGNDRWAYVLKQSEGVLPARKMARRGRTCKVPERRRFAAPKKQAAEKIACGIGCTFARIIWHWSTALGRWAIVVRNGEDNRYASVDDSELSNDSLGVLQGRKGNGVRS